MFQKPSVGRIVHFFTKNPIEQKNGIGDGPYAAIITQVFANHDGHVGPATFINLHVLAPFNNYDMGSVRHKSIDADVGSRWWDWPESV